MVQIQMKKVAGHLFLIKGVKLVFFFCSDKWPLAVDNATFAANWGLTPFVNATCNQ
jgi:hypothetical protein